MDIKKLNEDICKLLEASDIVYVGRSDIPNNIFDIIEPITNYDAEAQEADIYADDFIELINDGIDEGTITEDIYSDIQEYLGIDAVNKLMNKQLNKIVIVYGDEDI